MIKIMIVGLPQAWSVWNFSNLLFLRSAKKSCDRCVSFLFAVIFAFVFVAPLPSLHANELMLSMPLDYQVIQRASDGKAAVHIAGTLSEKIMNDSVIEARLMVGASETAWQKLDANIEGRSFRAQRIDVAGGWHRLEVRVSQAGQETLHAVVEHVGIGEVFVVAGQSNSANHGEEKCTSQTGRVASFDGLTWQIANDPQPGASGNGGSFIPFFGDAVAETCDLPVGIVACGIGATSIREWLPKGSTFPNPPTIESRIEKLDSGQWASKGDAYAMFIKRIKPFGVHGFRAVLWHQGESDANQQDPTRTLSGNLYREYLEKLIRDSRRDIGWEAPWFVAQVSYHVPGDEASPDIRSAQASLWKDGIALEGPDSDAMKGDLRERGGQGVHFSAKGLREHGAQWAEKIVPWVKLQGRTQISPTSLWQDYDPDKGDFKEEIIKQEIQNGIFHRDSYISAYVLGEEIRVYCRYSVKAGATKAPGLIVVHGWMGSPNTDRKFVDDGWAVMAHDYCGKTGDRQHFTKYPDALRHGNMDAKVAGPVRSKTLDGEFITDPKQTSDYLWYAIQRRVLSYLEQQKEVDRTRLGATGYSYGGTLMWNLATDPRVKAVVAYFGIGYNDYYRDQQVWLYNVPYLEPAKSPGEEIILASIAPEAHVPFITAATLFLNGSNDHHGGHERGLESFKNFPRDVPWSFAIQVRGHHDTDKIEQNTKFWLEKHVLGKDHTWPEHPQSEIRLDADGVPELVVTPASPDTVRTVEIFYALKNPVSFSRSWRDTPSVRQGPHWIGKMPVLNIDDYVFGYANITDDTTIVRSTDFNAAIPAKLGSAKATGKPFDKNSDQ